MNRAALYALVWERPITHVAKDFGVSDVAIRKICIKHGVPTPPLGYWAKLKHGKKVIQPPLPPIQKGQSDSINLQVRQREEMPSEIVEAVRLAKQELSLIENKILVPTARPANLHPVALASEKVLRKAKPDNEGFVVCGGAGKFNAKIGPASIDRVVIVIHATAFAAVENCHKLSISDDFCIVVDEQPLAVRIYEIKDKKAHLPTPDDLKRQAKEDEWRLRCNITYGSSRNVYPAWDYFPTGRLVIEISDPKLTSWNADHIVGRWRDTSSRRLEDRLGEVMMALKVGGVTARHRRAKEAEEAHIAREVEEKRREQDIQRRLLEKVTKFLMEKADKHGQLLKLEGLKNYLEKESSTSALDKDSELNSALEFSLVNLRNRLTADALNEEIIQTGLLDVEHWW
jgi:hypothetical protein